MQLKVTLLFLSLCSLSPTTAQIIQPNWDHEEPIEKQFQKFENGQIWIKNFQRKDTLWRTEFTTGGDLSIKAQITQVVFGDTITEFNVDRYEEIYYVMLFKKDLLDGRFIQYFANGKIKEKASMQMVKKSVNGRNIFLPIP